MLKRRFWKCGASVAAAVELIAILAVGAGVMRRTCIHSFILFISVLCY
jgi:hypothetical protein